jgi:hypothetical protein
MNENLSWKYGSNEIHKIMATSVNTQLRSSLKCHTRVSRAMLAKKVQNEKFSMASTKNH